MKMEAVDFALSVASMFDPEQRLSFEETLKLVEEKFTSTNTPMQAKAQIDEQLCAIEKIVGDAPLYSCELLFRIKNVRQLLHG